MANLKKYGPGFYLDVDTDTVHLDLAEMCTENGYEPTPENQAQLGAAARGVFAGVKVEEHDDDDGWRNA